VSYGNLLALIKLLHAVRMAHAIRELELLASAFALRLPCAYRSSTLQRSRCQVFCFDWRLR
jgi:hypothetical protein